MAGMIEAPVAQERTDRLPRRAAYLGLGYCSLGLAVAGVALPLLPTTPFLLVAAWAFGRSSPRLRRWLDEHPRFGPPLRHWREERAIPPKIKATAIAALGGSWAVTTVTVGGILVPGIAAAAMLGVGAFILTRPSPRLPAEEPRGEMRP